MSTAVKRTFGAHLTLCGPQSLSGLSSKRKLSVLQNPGFAVVQLVAEWLQSLSHAGCLNSVTIPTIPKKKKNGLVEQHSSRRILLHEHRLENEDLRNKVI
jgi:hypothetical protein